MQQKPIASGCVRMPGGGSIQIQPMASIAGSQPAQGGVSAPRSTSKVVLAALDSLAQNPAFESFEQIYRVMPDGAWFDPTRDPSNPTQFEIDADTNYTDKATFTGIIEWLAFDNGKLFTME